MLGKIYNSLIKKRRDAVSFIILLFFFITFVFSRTYIYLDTAGIISPKLGFVSNWNQNIRGVHVHHFAFGIIILSVSGYLSLVFHGKKSQHLIAALYGIGLALSYDEFGMWLNLEDNYWIRQSYDAMAVILALLINVVYFTSLWQKIFLKLITFGLRLLNLRPLRSRRLVLPRQGRATLK